MESWYDFQERTRRKFNELWGVQLKARNVSVGGVAKKFPMVSPDMKSYIGGAKKLQRGSRTEGPDSGERSFIAEYVWLLQHCALGMHKFIVFGHDEDVQGRHKF